jgi:HK97 family phage portal protein
VNYWHRFLGMISGAGWRTKGLQSERPSATSSTASAVTIDTALSLSAVWACARLIAESIASLPICIYKVDLTTGKRTKIHDHPLAILFNGKVNRWQTRIEFFETLTYQLVLLGNNYVVKQRNDRGQLIGLLPLMTQQMQVELQTDGAIIYRYTDGSNVNIYSADTIWHNKLFGNGVMGLSPLGYARNSIGIGIAAEESVTKIYDNGGKPSGVLTIDKLLTAEQREAIKSNFSEMTEGSDHRLFVLEAGMKFQQVSLSPQDIELLASRKFQIEDIARFFGVPSVLINDTQTSTTWGSGIQQIVQGFYKLGLRPYLERYEASMKTWLLTPQERATMDIEFDFTALTLPMLEDRIKMYKDSVQGGIMTPKECRDKEGLPSKEGDDQLYMQRQMVPLKDLPNIKDTGGSNAYQSNSQG